MTLRNRTPQPSPLERQELRRCRTCHAYKELGHYYRHPTSPGGRKIHCNSCCSVKQAGRQKRKAEEERLTALRAWNQAVAGPKQRLIEQAEADRQRCYERRRREEVAPVRYPLRGNPDH